MANEIGNMLAGVATVVGNVSTAIRKSTEKPSEQGMPDPFAYVIVLGSTIEVTPIGTRISLTDVAVDFLKVRKDLPRDLATLYPYLDSIPAALITEIGTTDGGKFGNTMQTFGRVKALFLPEVIYGGAQYIGYRFIMEECKILVKL